MPAFPPGNSQAAAGGPVGAGWWVQACGSLEHELTAAQNCSWDSSEQFSLGRQWVSALIRPGFKVPSRLLRPCSCVALRQPHNLSEPSLP